MVRVPRVPYITYQVLFARLPHGLVVVVRGGGDVEVPVVWCACVHRNGLHIGACDWQCR